MLRTVAKRGVRFVRLWFVDVAGGTPCPPEVARLQRPDVGAEHNEITHRRSLSVVSAASAVSENSCFLPLKELFAQLPLCAEGVA